MKKILVALILLVGFALQSQIVLEPLLGFSFSRNRKVSGDDYFFTKQNSSGLTAGVSLNYKLKDFTYKLVYDVADSNVGARYNYVYSLGKGKASLVIGTAMYSFGPDVAYSGHGKNRLRIIPSLGFRVSKIQQRVNWQGSSFAPDDTTSNIPDTGVNPDGSFSTGNFSVGSWDVGPEGSDKIVLNYFGVALRTGVKFQFKNKLGKDRLALNLVYSQGFVTHLQSVFSINHAQQYSPNKGSAQFASRGSFLSFNFSYPITVVNKKGERRKDRN